MELKQFKSFQELILNPVSESEYKEIQQLIDKIYKTSFENQIWIEAILDFLNDNKNEKKYNEYYLRPDFSWDTRKNTYRFISTEEDMPHSITDSDVYVLKKFNAKTPFILYDYEEEPSVDIFDYLTQQRTLKKVLESIGMSDELKEHLCEFCFYKIKEDLLKEQQKNIANKEKIELSFKNHDFNYILKVLSMCEKTLDLELLNLISINTQDLLSNPNADKWNKDQLKELIEKSRTIPGCISTMNNKELTDFYNERIVEWCEDILIQIISISSDNYEYFGHILEQLYVNQNKNIRLHCCANGDYTKFLNDPSPRVAKVANIRYNFEKKWNSLSVNDIEKQRIEFLISAYKNGEIGFIDNDVLIMEGDDKSSIGFISVLFEKTNNQIFDSDILYTIKDKRILADTINELIKKGEIVLNHNMIPDYFKNESEISQGKNATGIQKKLTKKVEN